jgi:hypothetical protein
MVGQFDDRISGGKRGASDQQLPQQAAQGVQFGAGRLRLCGTNPFGGGAIEAIGVEPGMHGGFGFENGSNPDLDQDHLSCAGEEEVVQPQVAVEDVALFEMCQALEKLPTDRRDDSRRETANLDDEFPQAGAIGPGAQEDRSPGCLQQLSRSADAWRSLGEEFLDQLVDPGARLFRVGGRAGEQPGGEGGTGGRVADAPRDRLGTWRALVDEEAGAQNQLLGGL